MRLCFLFKLWLSFARSILPFFFFFFSDLLPLSFSPKFWACGFSTYQGSLSLL